MFQPAKVTLNGIGNGAVRGLALATVNLSITFEVSTSTHYKGMKCDTKYRKRGGLG